MSRSPENHPSLLHQFTAAEYPPNGGLIVWNPRGTGRLRTLYGPFSVPAPESGALDRREVILTLDGTPLVRRQATECPTCLQLLQVGSGSDRQAETFAAAINQITVADMLSGDSEWLSALFPVLELLPSGFYLLTLDRYYPTDGSGRFFWTAFSRLTRCDPLSLLPEVQRRPAFLAPTQPTSKFSRASFEAAQVAFTTKPGLALALAGTVSALLDGHHRALCAARNHTTVPCITIQELYWPEGLLGSNVSKRLPSAAQDRLRQATSYWNDAHHEVGQREVDQLVAQIEETPAADIPAEFSTGDLRTAYPGEHALAGLEIIGGAKRHIADQDVEDVLSGRRPDHWFYGDPVRLLLRTLFQVNDPRAVPVGIRVARDFRFRQHWELAFQLLATRRSPEVDDFFVEFLCARDQPERPELTVIVDSYFREAGNPG